jgi:hypothetical protein
MTALQRLLRLEQLDILIQRCETQYNSTVKYFELIDERTALENMD